MHDARDEEDKRLLDAGDHAALVRSYYETIIQRCRVRCRREDDALECAQSVAVRLLSELKRGKRYSVPFRVVVHKVIEWTTKGFYAQERDFADRRVDLKFARACVRLYSELSRETEDEEYGARFESYRSLVESLEIAEEESIAS
jgi:hypothetical protein